MEGLYKIFYGCSVLSEICFQLFGNQRARIAGRTGSGKSTLLNLILGTLNPDRGRIRIVTRIRIRSLSQESNELAVDRSGKSEPLGTNEHSTRSIQCARALGLTADDLELPIRTVSREQQTKLAIAKVLLGNPNLLVLAESTDYIELETNEAIESALKDFRGAILGASHDRYFTQAIGNR